MGKDLEAFETAITDPDIYGSAQKNANLGNHHDAEDATQDAVVSGLEYIKGGGKIEKPVNWLRTAAYNSACHIYKERKRWQHSNIKDAIDMPSPTPAPDQESEKKELREVLEATIENLPERQRRVVTMRVFDGLSHKEIAEQMGDITENYVRQIYRRALRKLARDPSVKKFAKF